MHVLHYKYFKKIPKCVKIVYNNFEFFIIALLGSLEETTEESNPEEEEVNVQDMLKLDPNRIKSVTFPNYVDPNVKDDMVIFFMSMLISQISSGVTKQMKC